MLNDKAISKVTLKNNTTLIHKKINTLPIVSIYVFMKAGSVSDPAEKLGVANLTNSLLTRGTKTRTRDQIALEIESMGGGIGSDTGEDFSFVSLSITKPYLEKATELLADILLNPVFPYEELNKEKTVITAGIKARKDHIFDVAMDLLRQNIFSGHPYVALPQGTEETLKSITRDDLISWHNKYHVRENIFFVVTGDISLSEAKKLIEKYFSGIPGGIAGKAVFKEINQEKKEIAEKTAFNQAYLMYGFLTPEISHPDYTALKMLNSYLGGGMSSLLFQELREKAGLGYEVHSFYPTRKDKSTFVIYIGLDKSSLDLAKKKINALIDDMRNGKIDEKRFEDSKKYLRGTYLLDHQTNARQGWYLGWWEIMGKGYEYDSQYVKDIDTITPAVMTDAAKRYLTDKHVMIEVTN